MNWFAAKFNKPNWGDWAYEIVSIVYINELSKWITQNDFQ